MNHNRIEKTRYDRWLPILLALLALTGCTTSTPIPTVTPQPTPESTPENTPESTSPAAESDPLAGTNWQLTALGETPVVAGSMVTLEFSAGGQATGNAGCNSYGGPYMVQGDTLQFGEIVSTLMACADAHVMAQEQQYLAALRSAGRFTSEGDQLTISYDNDSGQLTFTAAAAASNPSPAAPTETTTAPPTPLPTAALEPTAVDSATPSAEAARINFDPGQSSTEINGTIAERATDIYVLRAQQGQIMSVEITSPNNDVLLSVIGADGTPLKRYQNGPPSWTSQLPATQDYFIHAVSVGPATDYTLRVWVEPLSAGGPERVEFSSGATSASRSGALPEGGVKEYVLAASANQTMFVQTIGYSAPVNFTVRSPGGATWSGEPQGSEVYIFATQVVLPQSGDYVVTLSLPPDAGATRYDVAFTIVSGTAAMERIRFAAGQDLSSVAGSLGDSASDLYVLRAAKGQTMTVDLTFTIVTCFHNTPISPMI